MPEAGTEYLTPDQAAAKTADFLSAELSKRLAKAPVRFGIAVQLAQDGDVVDDATAVWPDDRPVAAFGTLTITERTDELAPEKFQAAQLGVVVQDQKDAAGGQTRQGRSMDQQGARSRSGPGQFLLHRLVLAQDPTKDFVQRPQTHQLPEAAAHRMVRGKIEQMPRTLIGKQDALLVVDGHHPLHHAR